MYLKSLELQGFKSFGKKSVLEFSTSVTAIVGPNGSGKSNVADSFRFALGEQSTKSMRGKRGEDLIWGGSGELPRSNRASVKILFDNTKRLLDVDFDEVVLERVVFRDGINEYLVNGSKVRLKDVQELLAAANIGASGHHIISQGEADRVLSATPKERRYMIEDALGLRVYQYKKDESERKLDRTEENMRQVESLRKENQPHLKFLERQVKKIEKARELRSELVGAYQEYLRRESDYIAYETEAVSSMRSEPKREYAECEQRVALLEAKMQHDETESKEHKELRELQEEIGKLRGEVSELERNVGRIEGQITFEERRLEREQQRIVEEEGKPVPYRAVRSFWDELTAILDKAHGANGDQIDRLKSAVHDAQKLLRTFVERHRAIAEDTPAPDRTELERLELEKAQAESRVEAVRERLTTRLNVVDTLREVIESYKLESREQERELFAARQRATELRGELSRIALREADLERTKEEFEREVREGAALIGRQVMGYKDHTIETRVDLDASKEDERSAQHERRRALEKLKVRLEEMGGSNADEIHKEYQETKERDEFLERELADLQKSAESLRALIKDLEQELAEKFDAGVSEINTQFSEFFTLMFGGGSAKLVVQKAEKAPRSMVGALMDSLSGAESEVGDENRETGVDIEVSLPKKRIQSLMVLSGGERTLTSIALIFAMSQVNPPPFIILDETDAALDEANSRRYGDMIKQLAHKSQLIVITHNRETMSRAGVLYGITMGIDGVSKILSVKFDEAVAVAK